jgi:hypothetical protein
MARASIGVAQLEPIAGHRAQFTLRSQNMVQRGSSPNRSCISQRRIISGYRERNFYLTNNLVISKAVERKKFLALKIGQVRMRSHDHEAKKVPVKLSENDLCIKSYGAQEGKGWNLLASRNTAGRNAGQIVKNEGHSQ